MVLRGMEGPRERGVLDQELINKELPPQVDRDDRRRVLQVRDRHRFAGQRRAHRRPFFRQLYSVIKRLARPDGAGQGKQDQEGQTVSLQTGRNARNRLSESGELARCQTAPRGDGLDEFASVWTLVHGLYHGGVVTAQVVPPWHYR